MNPDFTEAFETHGVAIKLEQRMELPSVPVLPSVKPERTRARSSVGVLVKTAQNPYTDGNF